MLELRKLSTVHPRQTTPVKSTRAAKNRVTKFLFGIPLSQALNYQKEKYPEVKIPIFIKRALKHLIREGTTTVIVRINVSEDFALLSQISQDLR